MAVSIEDRATGAARSERVPAVVGADGIHSAVRHGIAPPGDAVRYAGRMLWRATTVAPSFLTGASMIMAGHQDQKFVCYPITPPAADGTQVLNWIAELPVAELPAPQDWSREVDRARFRDAFAAWRFGWLDVPALIDGAERVYEYPLADRDPLDSWGGGRVTLLGDAAHPMYPIGSNGASQAILDAEALAAALAAGDDVPAALAGYQAARREATGRIILANRGNGPEQVMQLARRAGPGRLRRHRRGDPARGARGDRGALQAARGLRAGAGQPEGRRSVAPRPGPAGARRIGSGAWHRIRLRVRSTCRSVRVRARVPATM